MQEDILMSSRLPMAKPKKPFLRLRWSLNHLDNRCRRNGIPVGKTLMLTKPRYESDGSGYHGQGARSIDKLYPFFLQQLRSQES